MSTSFTATGVTSDGLPISLTGTIGGGSTPPPPLGVNVREKGAKGDGITDDWAAIQAVLDGLSAGQAAYLPAGVYKSRGALLVRRAGTGIFGDGDTSELQIGVDRGLWIGSLASPANGVSVKKLAITAQPGVYGKDGNVAHAILFDGASDGVVEDVLLKGAGQGVYSVAGAVRTVHRRVRVRGWGGTALGLNTGALVEECDLVQDDPNLLGQRSGHGLYFHNGTQDAVVKNTTVANARMFGCHIYGEQVGFPTGPITLQNCVFRDCFASFICANFPAEAARVQGLTVTDCQFLNGYGGISVALRQGDGITFQRNTIKNAVQGFQGLAIGQWGPNDLNGVIRRATFSDLVIDGFQYGLYLLNSNNGKFEATTVGGGLKITNCTHPLIVNPTPGVTLTP